MGQGAVRIVLTSVGTADVEYVATYVCIPKSGIWLEWSGSHMRQVRCIASDGHATAIASSRRAVVSLRADPTARVTLSIRYSLRLNPLAPGNDAVYRLSARNFPRADVSVDSEHSRSTPFDSAPDTIIYVRNQVAGFWCIGPQHRLLPGGAAPGEHVFSMYDGLTPFTMITGRFAAESAEGEVRLLSLQSALLASWSGLAREVTRYASEARSHFTEMFGPAAVNHRSIVLIALPGARSVCAGSGIVVNVAEMLGRTNMAARQARLLDAIAHEYAHTWWSYSGTWRDAETHDVLEETVASVLARDCVAVRQGSSGLSGLAEEQWAHVAYAVSRSERALSRDFNTSSAAYASALLAECLGQDRAALVGALEKLRSEARTTPLSRRRVFEVIEARLTHAVAAALDEALTHPRPVVLPVRIGRTKSARWALVLRPPRARTTAVWRRLTAAGFELEAIPGSPEMAVLLAGPTNAPGTLYALEPAHVLSRRSHRLLWIHRHPFLRRLWTWALHCTNGPGTRSTGGWWAATVGSMVCLILNPEDPAGWRGLREPLERLWPAAARRCGLVASRRAIFAGEEHLAAQLETLNHAVVASQALGKERRRLDS